MAIHPPALYVGFVGMAIPYAFAMAALITDASTTRGCRPCAMDDAELAVPLVRADARDDLGVRGARMGRLLGVGPGGERGLLPWFTATAFLHSLKGAGAAGDAARLERLARRDDVSS